MGNEPSHVTDKHKGYFGISGTVKTKPRDRAPTNMQGPQKNKIIIEEEKCETADIKFATSPININQRDSGFHRDFASLVSNSISSGGWWSPDGVTHSHDYDDTYGRKEGRFYFQDRKDQNKKVVKRRQMDDE